MGMPSAGASGWVLGPGSSGVLASIAKFVELVALLSGWCRFMSPSGRRRHGWHGRLGGMADDLQCRPCGRPGRRDRGCLDDGRSSWFVPPGKHLSQGPAPCEPEDQEGQDDCGYCQNAEDNPLHRHGQLLGLRGKKALSRLLQMRLSCSSESSFTTLLC